MITSSSPACSNILDLPAPAPDHAGPDARGNRRDGANLIRVLGDRPPATVKAQQRDSQRPTSPRPPTAIEDRRQRAPGPPFSAPNGPPNRASGTSPCCC